MKCGNEKGMILVMTLLFLLILSLLAISALEYNALQARASRYAYNRARAFAAAEAGLIMAAKGLVGTTSIVWSDAKISLRVQSQLQGVNRVEANYQGVRVVLEAKSRAHGWREVYQ